MSKIGFPGGLRGPAGPAGDVGAGQPIDGRAASGHVVPDTSGIWRLGSGSIPWEAVYGDQVYISGVSVGDYLDKSHANLNGLDADDHTQYLLRSDFATSGAELTQYALASGDFSQQRISHFHFETSGIEEIPEHNHGGTLHYDQANDTLAFHPVIDPSIELQLGQEVYIRGVNKTGGQINNGEAVRVSGAQGNRPTIAKAIANDGESVEGFLGLATHNIADNAEGFITVIGNVNEIDTSAFSVGDELYLSADTAGALTNTRPVSPNYVVHVGHVLTSHANQGRILVNIDSTSYPDPLVFNSISNLNGMGVSGLLTASGIEPHISGNGAIGTNENPFSSGSFSTQLSISGIAVGDYLTPIAPPSESGNYPSGVVIHSPNGSGWLLTIDNTGAVNTSGPFAV